MSKTVLNFWLDVCLLCAFLTLCAVSAILQFVFPIGPDAGGWRLWGWGYVAWRDFQFGVLCVFAGLVLLHVMLHWTWVCGVVTTKIKPTKQRPDEGQRTLWGVGTLIVLLHVLVGVVVAALLTIVPAV